MYTYKRKKDRKETKNDNQEGKSRKEEHEGRT
jgi:hypothetical protein